VGAKPFADHGRLQSKSRFSKGRALRPDKPNVTARSVYPCRSLPRCSSDSDVDFARFLHIAADSASELEYHSTLAKDLKLLQYPEYEVIYEELTQIKRMLSAFTNTLKADN